MPPAMKKAEAMLPSSNFKLSLTSSAPRRKRVMLPMSGSSRFRCRNGRATASLSRRQPQLFASRSDQVRLMKYLISLAILIAAAPLVRAQEVVTDPVSDALNEEMHLEDLAKYVQMVENQVQQIETLTQELEQVEAYVKAFGDPSQILNVTGAN